MKKRARAICDEMELRHVPCWISSRDVRPGRNYQSEIIDALENATHLILVFSTNSNKSEEVARELSLASKKKIPHLSGAYRKHPADGRHGVHVGDQPVG